MAKKKKKAPTRPARAAEPPVEEPRLRFAIFALIVLVLSAVLAAFIDFPPGDSWTHGWTVGQWIQGDFILNDWSSAIALPQQILGWVIHLGTHAVHWPRLCILTAIVTVGACLIAALLPARLYPQWPRLKAWAPLFAVAMLAPTFTMKIAAGFMTDGYYLLLLTASLWVLIGLLNKSAGKTDRAWIAGWVGFTALAVLASLQRTHGLMLLIIIPLWILVAKITFPASAGSDVKKREEGATTGWEGWRGWIAVILCVVGLLIVFAVFQQPSLHPARSAEIGEEVRDFWNGDLKPEHDPLTDQPWFIFDILQHLGLALLPISLIARLERTKEEKKGGKRSVNWWYVAFGTAFMLATFARWANGDKWELEQMFPYIGNSLTPEGFGPRNTLALTAGHELGTGIRFVLTVLGTGGGIVGIWLLSRSVRFLKVDWRAPSTLVGFLGLAHLGLIFVNFYFFDRYLLPLMPFALCWLAPFLRDAPAKTRLSGWILAVLYLVFAVWGTVDSLAWSKSKWDLAAEARGREIAPNHLIAGYEVDGFFNYTNETYPGMEVRVHPLLTWWVLRLGLRIVPAYIIFEEGAETTGTSWEAYVPTDIENGRMRVWVHPDVVARTRSNDAGAGN